MNNNHPVAQTKTNMQSHRQAFIHKGRVIPPLYLSWLRVISLKPKHSAQPGCKHRRYYHTNSHTHRHWHAFTHTTHRKHLMWGQKYITNLASPSSLCVHFVPELGGGGGHAPDNGPIVSSQKLLPANQHWACTGRRPMAICSPWLEGEGAVPSHRNRNVAMRWDGVGRIH